jgi:hypothetical protein
LTPGTGGDEGDGPGESDWVRVAEAVVAPVPSAARPHAANNARVAIATTKKLRHDLVVAFYLTCFPQTPYST